MKLISLSYRNFKCFDELDIKPEIIPGKGSLTIISGRNQLGKTAVLDGLIAVFDGGHSASDIRTGTKKATIELIVEDNGKQWSLLKKMTPSRSTLEVRPILEDGERGEELPSPQTWAEKIASGIAFNPLDFIEDKAKRTAWLQKSLPMEFTLQEVTAAVSTGTAKQKLESAWTISGANGAVDLDGLIKIRERLAEIRKESNGRLKQIEGSIANLKTALPADGDGGEDWNTRLATVNTELGHIRRQKGDTLRDVDAAEKEALEAGEAEMQLAITQARKVFDGERDRIQASARQARMDVEAEYHDREIELTAKQTTAQNNLQQASKQIALRQEYDKNRESRKLVETEAVALDDCVKALDDIRKNKSRTMPVDGAEIRDGELYINGLPFEGNVSTSEQIRVALQFASLGNNPLSLVVIDRLESFDPERMAELEQVIKESGFQVFGTRVTAGDLKVEHGK